MNEEQALRRRINAIKFASWELHLFLDTHPNNCDAARKLEEYRRQLDTLTKEFEDKFGPIGETPQNTNRWAWISDPWPWEKEAN
ncbi:spore coat protein CotJB [bacterium D16-76]|nr:spore coat protein CotJB [bacterium D16-76]